MPIPEFLWRSATELARQNGVARIALLRRLDNHVLVKVRPQDDVDDVADIFAKYKFMVLPVVDESDHLEGVITLKDVVEFKR
jgi:Mg/Co/Ni transporter MgtE